MAYWDGSFEVDPKRMRSAVEAMREQQERQYRAMQIAQAQAQAPLTQAMPAPNPRMPHVPAPPVPAKSKEQQLAELQAREEAQKQADDARWEKREAELAAIEVDRDAPFIGLGDVRWMIAGRKR